MTTIAAYISLADLTNKVGKTRRTVYTYLRRKHIRTEGHSVSMAELAEKWPEAYRSLMLAHRGGPCPECMSPTSCRCTVCTWAV
jgi:hypothetical protein